MSRVGKLPVSVSQEVNVKISGLVVEISGPKGVLKKEFFGPVSLKIENNQIFVSPLDSSKQALSMWGTVRNVINSMVIGVTKGFFEELEVNGVGFRAAVKGKYLNLSLGKSHNTKIEIPSYIKVDTPKQNLINLESFDKEKLGQYVAVIRSQRPPEPYKGKGIKRKNEYIQRKEGKKG